MSGLISGTCLAPMGEVSPHSYISSIFVLFLLLLTKRGSWSGTASNTWLKWVAPIETSLHSWNWLGMNFPVPVPPYRTVGSALLVQLPVMTLFLHDDLLVGGVRQYTIYVMHHCGVNPFSYGGDWLPLIYVWAVGKYLEGCPRLEVGGLLMPFSDVIVESFRLCNKGNTFWHHHGIGNRLP